MLAEPGGGSELQSLPSTIPDSRASTLKLNSVPLTPSVPEESGFLIHGDKRGSAFPFLSPLLPSLIFPWSLELQPAV